MTDTMSLSDSVLLGVITSAHGLKGQFKVKSFTDPPSNLVDYGSLTLSSGAIITPRLVGVNKGLLICAAKEIEAKSPRWILRRVCLVVKVDPQKVKVRP